MVEMVRNMLGCEIIWKVKCTVFGDGCEKTGLGRKMQVSKLIPRFLAWTNEWLEMRTGGAKGLRHVLKWHR